MKINIKKTAPIVILIIIAFFTGSFLFVLTALPPHIIKEVPIVTETIVFPNNSLYWNTDPLAKECTTQLHDRGWIMRCDMVDYSFRIPTEIDLTSLLKADLLIEAGGPQDSVISFYLDKSCEVTTTEIWTDSCQFETSYSCKSTAFTSSQKTECKQLVDSSGCSGADWCVYHNLVSNPPYKLKDCRNDRCTAYKGCGEQYTEESYICDWPFAAKTGTIGESNPSRAVDIPNELINYEEHTMSFSSLYDENSITMTGAKLRLYLEVECSEDAHCPAGEACIGDMCVFTAECTTDEECDDANDLTVDICSDYQCSHAPIVEDQEEFEEIIEIIENESATLEENESSVIVVIINETVVINETVIEYIMVNYTINVTKTENVTTPIIIVRGAPSGLEWLFNSWEGFISWLRGLFGVQSIIDLRYY